MDLEEINVELQQAGFILMTNIGIYRLINNKNIYILAYTILEDKIVVCDNRLKQCLVNEFFISQYKEAIAWGNEKNKNERKKVYERKRRYEK